MKLDRGAKAAGPVVTGFAGAGFAGAGFKVDGEPIVGGVLLTPEWWRGWDGDLTIEGLELIAAIAPEFIILGTGASLVRPPRALIQALEERGIGLEPMDSRAAARAWAVLRAEDRWISAALMPLA